MRSLYHGLAVMRKVEWTPAFEFGSSLQGKLDHAIMEPGAQVNVTLTSLYPVTGSKLNASLVLIPGDKPLGTAEVDPAAMPFHTRVGLAGVTAGDYTIEVRLAGTTLVKNPAIQTVVEPSKAGVVPKRR